MLERRREQVLGLLVKFGDLGRGLGSDPKLFIEEPGGPRGDQPLSPSASLRLGAAWLATVLLRVGTGASLAAGSPRTRPG
jgi:hypothetical protein